MHGVEGPRLVAAQADGAHPDRRHLHLLGEERQELVPALDGDLHVLGDEFTLRHPPLLMHHGGQAVLLVDRDQLAVDVRTPVLARPEAADRLVLQAERARAPEPVGVPAPDVVLDREEVLAVLLQRLVVDLLAGVVAQPRCLVAERANGQVQFGAAERYPVEEVRLVPLVAAVTRDCRDRVHAALRVVEAEVPHVHVRFDRHQLDREGERVAKGAVGVREAVVEVAVLVVLGGDEHAAVAGEELHLGHRLMRQPVPDRGRLDAQAGNRPAQGNRLELRHDQRHQAVRQRGVAQVLIRCHPAHDGRPGRGVHVDNPGESRHVQADTLALPCRVAEPEEVRRRLRQPDRDAGRHRGVGVAQPRHGGLMSRLLSRRQT